MLILNFSHPMTEMQKREAEALTGQTIEEVYNIHVQFDNDVSYAQQAETLMQNLPVDGTTLQTKPILILLPSSNFIAAAVLASLHGLMGYFPAVLRISPEAGSLPPVYHAAEVLNLQAIRDKARRYR